MKFVNVSSQTFVYIFPPIIFLSLRIIFIIWTQNIEHSMALLMEKKPAVILTINVCKFNMNSYSETYMDRAVR